MKILYCNKYNFRFSGTEVYLFELMDLMRSHGHLAELFSMADPRGEATRYEKYLVPPVNFKATPMGRMTRLRLAGHAVYSTQARQCLRGMIAAFRPDLAHVRNIYHHLSPSVLWELKAQGVPVIYHLNDFKLICPSYNLVAHGCACEACRGGRFSNVVTQRCYAGGRSQAAVLAAEAYVHRWLGTYQKCVDQFVAPSQFVKEKLVQHGFAESRITVIRHFHRLPEQAFPSPHGGPILYFGRLSPEKGVAGLVRAMQHVRGVQLQIAGDGPLRRELETLAFDLKLVNVQFLGQLFGRELDRVIAASRFTVMPSLAYETFGKSILESFAWGRAVIASDLGSRRELVHHGENGLLFEPGNEEQMAETIAHLADRPRLAEAMGAAGRRLVETEHAPEQHYRAMAGLYERVVGNKHAPRLFVQEKKEPRVAFIGARGVVSKYSGIESYYEEVGARLAEMGYDVTVYCRNYFTPDVARYKGMRLVRLPTVRTKHLDTVVHTFLSTIHAMFSAGDIVHFHALGPALFSFLPRLAGKKTVVTVQGLDWQRKKWGRFAEAVLRAGEWASARFPNQTMVVSKTLQERYRNLHGTEAVYVPNGTTLRNRVAASQLVAWGLQPSQYILFLGRFSPEKNCHLLIEAYAQLLTPMKLVLAGGSSHTDAYAEQLRHHANGKIVFLNWVSGDALNELLTNAALFVLPSDLEGMSLALLDAMGAGICTLTSDLPENRELIEDVGFTFRPGDVGDLARMLALLISDEGIRKSAGEKALQKAKEQFLWPEIARRVSTVYEELAGAKKIHRWPMPEPAREKTKRAA